MMKNVFIVSLLASILLIPNAHARGIIKKSGSASCLCGDGTIKTTWVTEYYVNGDTHTYTPNQACNNACDYAPVYGAVKNILKYQK
jgi:hypothetical protein